MYPGPLRIGAPTTSYFEPELLPGQDRWRCVGALDLSGTGRLDVVLVARHALTVLRRGTGAWTTATTELPLGHGPPEIGCAAADFDGDGRVDVAVFAESRGVIAFNRAHGFEVRPLPAMPHGGGDATAYVAAALDADGDGRPDLYVGRSRAGSGSTFAADGCAVNAQGDFLCGRDGTEYRGTPNVLLHNEGGGSFRVVESSGAEDPRLTQALGVYDLDGDGRQDLIVCNDASPSRMLLSNGDLTFREVSAEMRFTQRFHCMGVAVGDLDGDGRPDFAFANIGRPMVLLGLEPGVWPLAGDRGFNPVAEWAWGTELEDLDNDGAPDLLLESELVPPEQWMQACPSCTYASLPAEELLLFRNNGEGYFSAEVPARLPANPPSSSHGVFGDGFSGGTALLVADLDDDGILDALILRHVGGMDAWLSEAWLLHGRLASPAGSIVVEAPQGAVVEVSVGDWRRRREVGGAHSFGAMHPNRVHFGLGRHATAQVSVEWPRGRRHSIGTVRANTRAKFP